MLNEERYIILSHKALQLLSQGADSHPIFFSNRETAVSD